jgi:hypothetical protein
MEGAVPALLPPSLAAAATRHPPHLSHQPRGPGGQGLNS